MPLSDLGPYRLESKLGAGGMGEVWRALDTRLGRPVALKVLPADARTDAETRRRFQVEVRAASGLNHPNLVTVFDAGEEEDRLYLAMELVDGRTVADLLRDGPLDPERCRALVAQALDGLATAHAAGVLHRDLKPENLMVRADGFLKILDFGLARLTRPEEATARTRAGIMLGTPEYIAPEILRGGEPVPASDLFSLGVVLYRMLSGRSPFPGASSFAILSAVTERPPEPLPEAPEDLRAVVFRALEKDPQERYPDAGAMRSSLTESAGAPVAAVPVVLVLPLESDPADREVADGVTEELIARLAELPGCRVLGRGTAFRHRGAEARQAAQDMNARFALEGHLRRSGTRVRVTAGLVDARDGCQVFSRRVEGEFEDVFSLEDRLAGSLAEALRETLGLGAPSEATEPAPAQARDPRAQELYLRGVHYLATELPDRGDRAAEVLKEAVRLDPTFAPAHARLALALVTRLLTASLFKAPFLALQAAREANRALALDPDNPEALMARAFLAMGARKPLEARKILREAAALRPGHTGVITTLAYVTLVLGNVREAEDLAREAARRDPGGLEPLLVLSYAMICEDRPEEALDAAERALRLDPSGVAASFLILMLDARLGHWEDARIYAQHLRDSSTSNVLSEAGLLFFDLATGERPTLTLKDVKSMRQSLDLERMLASVFAERGQTGPAMTLLRSARSRGYRNLAFLDSDGSLDCLRGSPEFQALRREIEEAIAADPEFHPPGNPAREAGP